MENKDYLLGALISAVNETDFSIAVTVIVGGRSFTGELISYKEYLSQIGETFGQSNDEYGLGEKFQELFGELARKVGGEAPEDTSKQEPNFIHMKNVKAQPDNFDFPLWRAKLSAIDAFVLGRLEIY